MALPPVTPNASRCCSRRSTSATTTSTPRGSTAPARTRRCWPKRSRAGANRCSSPARPASSSTAPARGRLQPRVHRRRHRQEPGAARNRPHRALLHAPLRPEGADRRLRRRDGAGDRGREDRRLRRVRVVGAGTCARRMRCIRWPRCRPSIRCGPATSNWACSRPARSSASPSSRSARSAAARLCGVMTRSRRCSRTRTCGRRCRASSRATGRTT